MPGMCSQSNLTGNDKYLGVVIVNISVNVKATTFKILTIASKCHYISSLSILLGQKGTIGHIIGKICRRNLVIIRNGGRLLTLYRKR